MRRRPAPLFHLWCALVILVAAGSAYAQITVSIATTASSLTFQASEGYHSQAVYVSGSGGTLQSWSARVVSGNWMTVSPTTSVLGNGALIVSVNWIGLASGAYSGRVDVNGIFTTGVFLSKAIPVTLNVTSVSLSPVSLSFNAQQGGPAPANQVVQVFESSSATSWAAVVQSGPWLSIRPATQGFSASVSLSGLATGTYSGSIRVVVQDNFGQQRSEIVPVTLIVGATAPSSRLIVSQPSLYFVARITNSIVGYEARPPSQAIYVSNGGIGSFSWTATDIAAPDGNPDWLVVSPGSGTTGSSFNVSIDHDVLQTLSFGSPLIFDKSFARTIQVSAGVGSVSIPVTLEKTSESQAPLLGSVTPPSCAPATASATPTSLGYSLAYGGAGTQVLDMVPVNPLTGRWSASSNVPSWLSLSSTSGDCRTTDCDDLQVTASAGTLVPGNYTGKITITPSLICNGLQADGTSFDVPVTMTIAAPRVTLGATSLSFNGQQGGANPTGQPMSLTVSPAGTSWTATLISGSWLHVNPNSGSGNATLTVSVDLTALPAATYTGTILVTTAGGTGPTLTVTLTVSPAAVAPRILLNSTALSFVAQQGGADPASQNISISNAGGGVLAWSAVPQIQTPAGGTWLVVLPGSGTAPSTLTVSVRAAGLAAGTYSGTVQISASGASNTPQSIGVQLTVGPGTPPSLAIAPSPGAISLTPGGSQTVTVSLTRSNFTGSVTLGVGDLPTGVTASVTQQPGTGSTGSITFQAAANAPAVTGRTVTLTASGSGVALATATVLLTVTGSGCSYNLDMMSINTVSSGGRGELNVNAQPGCLWTADSDVSWMVIVCAGIQDCPGKILYAYGENAGSSSRTGRITVGGAVFTLTQAGRPSSLASITFEPVLKRTLPKGYYVVEATLAKPDTIGGFWGVEVIASKGRADGGFNLGGFLPPSSMTPAFGLFVLDSAQTVTATLNAQTAPGTLLTMRFLDSNKLPVGAVGPGLSPLVLSRSLGPGFYIVEVYSSGVVPFTYQLGLQAPFFVGGVDTGGYLATSVGAPGFGAFYVAEEQDVSIFLYGRGSNKYGAAGAGDLTLTLRDANKNVLQTVTPP